MHPQFKKPATPRFGEIETRIDKRVDNDSEITVLQFKTVIPFNCYYLNRGINICAFSKTSKSQFREVKFENQIEWTDLTANKTIIADFGIEFVIRQ